MKTKKIIDKKCKSPKLNLEIGRPRETIAWRRVEVAVERVHGSQSFVLLDSVSIIEWTKKHRVSAVEVYFNPFTFYYCAPWPFLKFLKHPWNNRQLLRNTTTERNIEMYTEFMLRGDDWETLYYITS